MKSKSLKSLLKKVRRDLDWPVLERDHDASLIQIISYAHNKSHVILMPDKLLNRSSDLDYLHELGHATYCEKIHPLFATNIQFAPEENKRQFQQLIPALNAACDWFVGHWQMEIAPENMRKQLKEILPVAENVLGSSELPPLDVILDASMIIAQAIRYLDEPIDCGGVLKVAVDAFLSVPPDKPSIDRCVLLINRLLSTYTVQRVRFVDTGESNSWEVYLSDETTGLDDANAALNN